MNQSDQWERLGNLLIARRVELGFKTRAAFARHHNLSHDRGISAIENAERQNFSSATIASLEMQYEWEPGSIETVLAGGDPTPRGTSTDRRPSLADYTDSEVLLDLARRLTEGQLAAARLAELDTRRELANLPDPTADETRRRDERELTLAMDTAAFLRTHSEFANEARLATERVDELSRAFADRHGSDTLAQVVASHDSDEVIASVTLLASRDTVQGPPPPLDAAAFFTGRESEYERQVREQNEDAERPDV